MKEEALKIWSCKIGETPTSRVPDGADLPMRKAVAATYSELTGEDPLFIFSGWGAELDESERAVVENRAPSPEHYALELKRAAAPELYEALSKCRDTFMHYAELHAAKGTPEGADKAKANHDLATMCEAALLKATPQTQESEQ